MILMLKEYTGLKKGLVTGFIHSEGATNRLIYRPNQA